MTPSTQTPSPVGVVFDASSSFEVDPVDALYQAADAAGRRPTAPHRLGSSSVCTVVAATGGGPSPI
ncbi:hypothetical protein [Gordonia sp. NB41Y]|uniref:hypothetical protein n=1 Tax=Gordonia sp. NB41Y TaxID=875808 RepID=UPI0006B1C40C|nr:hypothetical protein [Gordonia sp. NB41Y]KOY49260.1 hypothetical protein ISGA_11435 [Gordonia sp. NB41Y]WLP89800.1 hypothetical protein Q9K23_19955 [Gordonia sp. NB41Y]